MFDIWYYLLAVALTGAVVGALLVATGPLKWARPTLLWLAPMAASFLVLVLPATFTIGTNISKSDLTNYNEFWSGLEKRAWVEETVCSKDGPCVHEYSCDPYQVPVTRTRTVTDSKGNSRTETYVEMETRYHDCPLVDREYSYFVEDTIGTRYTFGDHLFPENPEAHRWRGWGYERYRSLGGVRAGVPAEWNAVKERVEAGAPGGTTVRKTYKNYILAAQETVYRKHSDSIDEFLKAGLLPKLTDKITGHYDAEKVYFVDVALPDAGKWQVELQRFNGSFGAKQQGDLHLVFVNAERVPEGSRYTQALEAYWQSKALGKNTLSKNGVAVVVGLSGGQVKWTNGFTGMPMGNEAAVQALRSLELPTVTPEAFFSPTASLSQVLLGDHGYKRVEMANYKYLEASITPSPQAHGWMVAIGTFLCSLMAGALFYYYASHHTLEDASLPRGISRRASGKRRPLRSVAFRKARTRF